MKHDPPFVLATWNDYLSTSTYLWILLQLELHLMDLFVFCASVQHCTVTATLLNFVRLFRKAHEENLKQAELERKKVQKEEIENAKGVNLNKKGFK